MQLISETLTDEGYECFIASSVAAAIEIVSITPDIRLILTDLKMPMQTGADLIKIVEEQFDPNIQFVVMSGHASPRVEGNGIDITSYPFLRKPVSIETLLNCISSTLDAHQP